MTVARPRALSEKAIESAIMRNLRAMGFTVVKFSQPQRVKATAGTPDLLVLSSRWKLHLFVEVKTPRGKVSTAQHVWHREAREAGLQVIVATSTDEVIAELRRMGVRIL